MYRLENGWIFDNDPAYVSERELKYSREIECTTDPEIPSGVSGLDITEQFKLSGLLKRVPEKVDTSYALLGDFKGNYFEIYADEDHVEVRSDSKEAVGGVCKVVIDIAREVAQAA